MSQKPVKLHAPEEHGYCRGCKKWRKTLYKGYCAACREDYGRYHQKRPQEGPGPDAIFVSKPYPPEGEP